jgi:uncharacterized protein (TIGR03086 family)
VGDDRAPTAGRLLADMNAAITGTEVIVAGISAGQWGAPTPCAGVDVRELVNHLVAGNLYFAALASGTPAPDGDADVLGAEPAQAFRTAAASLTTALAAPGVLDRTYPLPFGRVPGLGLIEIRLIEHLGHGWDLARATGQPAPSPTTSPSAGSPLPAASCGTVPRATAARSAPRWRSRRTPRRSTGSPGSSAGARSGPARRATEPRSPRLGEPRPPPAAAP